MFHVFSIIVFVNLKYRLLPNVSYTPFLEIVDHCLAMDILIFTRLQRDN